MTTRKTDVEVEARDGKGPTKRLVLRREKVRDLKVRTGVRTGTVFVNSPDTVRPGSESSSASTITISTHAPSTVGQSPGTGTIVIVFGGGG